jgi:hypothetical protein
MLGIRDKAELKRAEQTFFEKGVAARLLPLVLLVAYVNQNVKELK